jgi:hypothetical protein
MAPRSARPYDGAVTVEIRRIRAEELTGFASMLDESALSIKRRLSQVVVATGSRMVLIAGSKAVYECGS